MPNYVANEISFSGNKDAIEKVVNAIRSDDGQNCIDFKQSTVPPNTIHVK